MLRLGQLDPTYVVSLIVSFVVAITVHECMHAWTASMLGDDTGRLLGRVSLNPADHFDPIGALMFLLIALGFPALAWGKPVPVNTGRLRSTARFGRHVSMAVVAFAGPMSNVVLGALAASWLRLAMATGNDLGVLGQGLFVFMQVNFWLAAFNMIPLPPLDGSRILAALLPSFWWPYLAKLEQYGIAILFALILVGSVGNGIISGITSPVFRLLMSLFFPVA